MGFDWWVALISPVGFKIILIKILEYKFNAFYNTVADCQDIF